MSLFSESLNNKYQIYIYKHADIILREGFKNEFDDIEVLLENLLIKEEQLVKSGGGKSDIAYMIDNVLINEKGWKEKEFITSIEIDGKSRNNPTHKIDCYKNRIALELEWNNKTEFYDRDLNNFRILNELDCISLGVILTRSTALNDKLKKLKIYSKYGASTTHMDKLITKIEGGGAGGCPVIAFGIKEECING
tara:strand:- start:723 stop:1304 length:582 start_codon:yes stop_codon:yes gene_type:complete